MRRLSHIILCIAAPAFTLTAPPLASTFVRLEIPDLVRESDRGVLAGRVLAMNSGWNDEGTMIWTEVSVLVTEDLTGGRRDVGRTLVFRVPGGQVGDRFVTMEGAPRFEVGRDIAVFASAWPDGSPMVTGYFQGLSFVRVGAHGQQILDGGRADGMTLRALREAVRAGGARR